MKKELFQYSALIRRCVLICASLFSFMCRGRVSLLKSITGLFTVTKKPFPLPVKMKCFFFITVINNNSELHTFLHIYIRLFYTYFQKAGQQYPIKIERVIDIASAFIAFIAGHDINGIILKNLSYKYLSFSLLGQHCVVHIYVFRKNFHIFLFPL